MTVSSLVVRHARLALRLMVRNPATSLVLLLTLGLGVGVNSVVFGLAEAVLLRRLPLPEPERLVAVYEAERGGSQNIPVADGNFPDVRTQANTMSGLAAHLCDRMLVMVGTTTHRVPTCGITADFFPILGVAPALGRVSSSELKADGPPFEAVIGYGFWQSVFGGDPQVLGRTLVILGQPVPIVGVMPRGFSFPVQTDVWVRYEAALGTSRTAHNLHVIGRLAPGVSPAAARGQMSAIAQRLREAHGAEIGDTFDLVVKDLREDLVGEQTGTLLLLSGIVGVVLLIACGNVAALLLARSLSRLGETAIRQALGASRRQLRLELLVESAVLGAVSAAVGMLLARIALSLLAPLVPVELLPAGPPALNVRVAGFSLALGVLAGVLCGLPVLQLTQSRALPLFQGVQLLSTGGSRHRGAIGVFVVLQYGLSLVSLATAGLFVKSLDRLLRTDPGFRTSGLVSAEVELPAEPPSPYADPLRQIAYYEALQGAVAEVPGVERVALAYPLPFTPPQRNGLALREGDSGEEAGQVWPDYRVVGSGYFAALGMPVLLGRDFSPHDASSSEAVAVVNQSLARALWGEASPLDQRLSLPGLDDSKRLLRVVGIVPDARYRALELKPRPAVYVPWRQHLKRASSLGVIAAVSGQAEAFVPLIRERVQAQDPGLPLGRVRTMDDVLRLSTGDHRLRSGLLSAFAGLALTLAVLGVYGVMSYSLLKRQRELALRVAMGASPGDIRRLVVRDGLRFVLAGQVLGLAMWPVTTRLLGGLLFEVRPTDPIVLGLVSVGLALLVLATCHAAARRVGTADPSALLKQS